MLCECGCGQEAGIYQETHFKTGNIKGMPKRFLKGHRTGKTVVVPENVTLEFLLDQTEPIPETGCFLWKKSAGGNPYAKLCLNGKKHAAHRIAWSLVNGPIPPGIEICHKCDTPPCINPFHLFAGTSSENTQDCETKGRARHFAGEDNGRARLGVEDVIEIRKATGLISRSKLARLYGVNWITIDRIQRGESWKNLVSV